MKSLATQLVKYGMSGGTAAVFDIGLFYLLYLWTAAVFLSACGSFLVAAGVNYALTSTFVFPVRRRTARQALQFMAFTTLGFLLNTGLTTLFYHLGAPPTLAKAAAVGIVFFSNFLVNRNVVFRAETAAPRTSQRS